jgi:hypothetical protein
MTNTHDIAIHSAGYEVMAFHRKLSSRLLPFQVHPLRDTWFNVIIRCP